jgi:hypothetical protein
MKSVTGSGKTRVRMNDHVEVSFVSMFIYGLIRTLAGIFFCFDSSHMNLNFMKAHPTINYSSDYESRMN